MDILKLFVLATLLTLSGCDLLGIGSDPNDECAFEDETYCWEFMGLDSRHVMTVTDTPWGLYAGTHQDGVFRFADNTWHSLGLDHALIGDILYVPTDTARVLVGVRPYSDEQTEAAVFASEDKGHTWLPWDGGLAAEHDNRQWAYALAMDPGNPERLFMGQSGPILRSVDGGQNWSYVRGGPSVFGMGVRDILISPKRDGTIWVGRQTAFSSAIVDVSKDWGESWDHTWMARHDGSINAFAIDSTNTDRLWAADIGGAWFSSDGGETWDWQFSLDRPGWLNGIVNRQGTLYAAANEQEGPDEGNELKHEEQDLPFDFELGFYRSTNGGETWEALAVPEGAGGAQGLEVDKEGHLLVPTRDGLWRVRQRTDS